MAGDGDGMFMTKSLNVTPETTEHCTKLTVRCWVIYAKSDGDDERFKRCTVCEGRGRRCGAWYYLIRIR